MLQAAPGAGKTEFACHVMRHIRRDAGRSRRQFVVVVPTLELVENFIKKAELFGLQFCRSQDFFGKDDRFDGVVLTYQAFYGEKFGDVQRLCDVHECQTTAVLDEVHHCENQTGWGKKVADAFVKARHVLMMTGTLWRTNGEPIAFVEYEQDGPRKGMAKADYHYTTAQALADGVIRHVQFDLAKGSVTNIDTERTDVMTADLAPAEAQKIMRPLLRSEGAYAEKQFIAAHNRLMDIRRHVKDAGGLYLASDKYQAAKAAEMIEKLTHEKPTLVTSDERDAQAKVADFRDSSKKWIVAVRMISEGCDIPRLAVLVWGTTTCTELFFRQAVGRVIRRRGDESLTAYVYLPAHPELRTYADNYLQEQAEGVRLKEEADAEQAERAARDPIAYLPNYVTDHHGTEETLWTGDGTPDEARAVQTLMLRHAYDYAKAREVLNDVLQSMAGIAVDEPPVIDTPAMPKVDRLKELRKEINRLVNQLWAMTGESQEHIHGRYKKTFNASLNRLDEDKLKRRLQQTKEELSRAIERNPKRWAEMGARRKGDVA